MCNPSEVIDALLKLHKNAWKDALRFVVEQSLKDHVLIADLKQHNRDLVKINAELRERLAEVEPSPKPWFETIIASAKDSPDVESVYPPSVTSGFPNYPPGVR